jgi:hypothetical protein
MKGKVTLVKKAEDSPASSLCEMPLPLKINSARAPRQFPVVSNRPQLPPVISEELVDYYGRVFCQGDFADLNMTFEQFLLVAAKFGALGLTCERVA